MVRQEGQPSWVPAWDHWGRDTDAVEVMSSEGMRTRPGSRAGAPGRGHPQPSPVTCAAASRLWQWQQGVPSGTARWCRHCLPGPHCPQGVCVLHSGLLKRSFCHWLSHPLPWFLTGLLHVPPRNPQVQELMSLSSVTPGMLRAQPRV